ncbi:major strawberry allergen Fra a 1-3-like [Malania oleifera]|uniref:major strawberry allergen Fra a 1-3-like n=1 Tax=Malania oleifera TaxID=397392 RepID=UPI0025ADDDF4|nr:major strawberry allergen Fra a 1-3-like [Malania oleifera]
MKAPSAISTILCPLFFHKLNQHLQIQPILFPILLLLLLLPRSFSEEQNTPWALSPLTTSSHAVHPAKIFKVFVLDFDTLIPEFLPYLIKNVETLQGDGGPGSIKQINFTERSKYKFVKNRVDGIDAENFTYSYSIIGGDALSEKLESISFEIKYDPAGDGSSFCKRTGTFVTKGEVEITEEKVMGGKEQLKGMFKAAGDAAPSASEPEHSSPKGRWRSQRRKPRAGKSSCREWQLSRAKTGTAS